MLDVVTFDERVILAAQFGRQRALHYLLNKWEPSKNRLVTALAFQWGLRAEDAADARREAILWIVDGIRKYKFAGPVRLRPHRLKAYLRILLRRRMLNFAREVRRKSRLARACRDQMHPLGAAIARQSLTRTQLLDPELIAASRTCARPHGGGWRSTENRANAFLMHSKLAFRCGTLRDNCRYRITRQGNWAD